jgi:hypothetical protein
MSKRRYLHTFTDRHGTVRYYFRRNGRSVALPGIPGAPEFELAYGAALSWEPPAPSSLPGGVIDLQRQGPLTGVYLLMLKGRVVYVGSSLNMSQRVAQHRTNGRPFDKAFYIATTEASASRLSVC